MRGRGPLRECVGNGRVMSIRQGLSARTPRTQWLLLAAVFLLIGGAIGLSLFMEHNSIDSGERQRLAVQAKVIDDNLGPQLHATNHALESIRSDLPTLTARADGKDLINRRLQAMSDSMLGMRTLQVLDAEGMTIASNRKELIGRDFHEREYFQAACQDPSAEMLYLASPYKTFLGVFAITMAKAVLDARGEFAGVIAATLEPEYFKTLLNSVNYAPDMRSSLIHSEGKVLLTVPDTQDLAGINFSMKPGAFFAEHMKSGQPASVFAGVVPTTGDERLTVFRTVQKTGTLMDKSLVVVVSRQMQSLFAPWRKNAYQDGVMLAILVLISAMGLYFHQRRQQAYDRLLVREDDERKRTEIERNVLQAQLQQAQKMESVGRLAGGVAHDFNNMLTVILGNVALAIEQIDPAQPIHTDLEEIRKAANRSADLTRQLLAFARKQVVTPKVLDLNETVPGIIKMLERLIGEDISLKWLPEANLWLVKVDPSQIDQILANLCINARDAIAGGGNIAIETGNSIFDEDYCAAHAGYVPGEYVRISVSDNGHGIDKETLAHIFEPFFTTKGAGKGTGLGLATVYGAVKQNNGFINVYSEPGTGTTFTIYLPRHEGGAGQERAAGAAIPHVRGHETILLVEDEPHILKLTTRILKRQGYDVLTAVSPGEAVRLASEYDGVIHLLLTDVVMPEMNGRDLAKGLQSRYRSLKVLFMSGYTANIIVHQGVLDQGVHFIQKPFAVDDLATKVRGVLDSE